MTDPVSDYISTNTTYKATAAKLAPIIQAVISVAHALEHRPQDFSFADPTTGLAAARTSKFPIQDWPTAETIQTAVFNWREAYSKALDAWNKVPKEAQDSLKAPEKPDPMVRHARP
jgi:hypothetical protein